MIKKTDIYSFLEDNYTIGVSLFSLFSHFPKDDENVNHIIRKNNFLLSNSFILKKDIIEVDNKGELIDYCKSRVLEVQNIHLLAKYNHALLAMTQNNQYAEPTINAYIQILDYYCSAPIEKYYIYLDLLKVIVSIYQKYRKKDINSLKSYLLSILFNNPVPPKLKLSILETINSFKKIFNSNELINIPSLCIDLYRDETDRHFKENILEYAILFSRITKDSSSLKCSAELLGDLIWDEIKPYDDDNIAISHMNEGVYEQIIKNYKIAKSKVKLERTLKAYEENKKQHKYIRMPIKGSVTNMNKAISQINKLIKQKTNESALEIITSLCFHNLDMLLPQYDFIEKEVIPPIKNFTYTTMMDAVNVDAWGNKTTTTHELIAMHQAFHLMFCNVSFDYVLLLIYNAMKRGIIDAEELRKALEIAGFDVPLIFNRGGQQKEIILYSILNIGLEEFLIQCKNYVEKKNTDWRFCIDFLTPKFESIIRIFANELGIPVTKVFDNGDSKLVTLENILQASQLKDIFNDDDLFLFKHTFIKEGLNIRNDVAHGLFMPEEYTADKAMLVFLSVLRLSKATMYFQKQQIKKQGGRP